MKFMYDESKSKDTVGQNWSEVFYDGKPDSWVLEIGNHWHKYHAEYMEVTQGRVKFSLDGKEVVLDADSGPLLIPRYAVHGFKFFKGEPTILKEFTDPAGSFKQEFFEDLFYTGPISNLSFLQVVRVFYDGDTYIALPGNIRILDQLFTWTVGYIASWIVQGKAVAVDREGHLTQGRKDR